MSRDCMADQIAAQAEMIRQRDETIAELRARMAHLEHGPMPLADDRYRQAEGDDCMGDVERINVDEQVPAKVEDGWLGWLARLFGWRMG